MAPPLSRQEKRAAAKAKLPPSDDEDDDAKTRRKKVPAVGSIHRGTVVGLPDFGAFVSLGNGFVDGLAHLTELAAGRKGRNLQSPTDLLKVGQQVWVLVKEVKAGDKVQVSVKAVDQETGKLKEKKVPEEAASKKVEKNAKTTEAEASQKKEKKPFVGLHRRNGALSKAGRNHAKNKERKAVMYEAATGKSAKVKANIEKTKTSKMADWQKAAAAVATAMGDEGRSLPPKKKKSKLNEDQKKALRAQQPKVIVQTSEGERTKRSLKRERQKAQRIGPNKDPPKKKSR